MPWKAIGGGARFRAALAPLPSGPCAALRTPNFKPSEAPVPVREAWGALRAELFVQSLAPGEYSELVGLALFGLKKKLFSARKKRKSSPFRAAKRFFAI